MFQRWQIAHYELQRRHREQELARTRAIVGAYGLDYYPQIERTSLPESLVVAWLAAEDPRNPS
jgi:hypothetical protein